MAAVVAVAGNDAGDGPLMLLVAGGCEGEGGRGGGADRANAIAARMRMLMRVVLLCSD